MATRASTSPYDNLNTSLSNIGQVFAEIPKYQALGAQREASTVDAATKASELNAKNTIGGLVQSFMAAPPEQRQQAVAGLTQGIVQAGGNANSVGDVMRALVFSNPNSTNSDRMGAFGAAGGSIGPDTAFTEDAQGNIAGRNSRLDASKTLTVENNKHRELSPGTKLVRADGGLIAEGAPTMDTQQAETFRTMSPEDRQRKVAGEKKTSNYRTPDGQTGSTYDGTTDAMTGQPLPRGTTGFSSAVSSPNIEGLSKSDASDKVQQNADLDIADKNLSRLQDIVKKYPGSLTGVSGRVIQTAQNTAAAIAQSAEAAGQRGISLAEFKGVLDKAQADTEAAAGGSFNPDLVEGAALINQMAYDRAKANSPDGRVSNQDIKLAFNETRGGLDGNDQELLGRINYFRQQNDLRRSSNNTLLKKAAPAPAVTTSMSTSVPAATSPAAPGNPTVADQVAAAVQAVPGTNIPAAALAGPTPLEQAPAAPMAVMAPPEMSPIAQSFTPVMSGVQGAPNGQVTGTPTTQIQGPSDPSAALQEAQRAIQMGAPRDAVLGRLQRNGIPIPEGF